MSEEQDLIAVPRETLETLVEGSRDTIRHINSDSRLAEVWRGVLSRAVQTATQLMRGDK
jgi:hypothetical protein